MRFSQIVCALILFTIGSGCGAPTPYQKYMSSKRSDCEIECQKAHTNQDISGRQTCVRACEVKKDMQQGMEKEYGTFDAR